MLNFYKNILRLSVGHLWFHIESCVSLGEGGNSCWDSALYSCFIQTCRQSDIQTIRQMNLVDSIYYLVAALS